MAPARIAIKAKIRTMEKPATPKRLCRSVDHEMRASRRRRRVIDRYEASNSERGAAGSDSDTWIEHSVEHVRDDVAEDDEDGNQEEDRAREEAILENDGDEQVGTQAVVREDVLEDNRAADDETEADREGRDDRQVGVSRGMALADHPLGEALRLCREDEIFAHHFEHGGLHEQNRTRGADEDERDHGQEPVDGDVYDVEHRAGCGIKVRPLAIPSREERHDATEGRQDNPRRETCRFLRWCEFPSRPPHPGQAKGRNAPEDRENSQHRLELDPLQGQDRWVVRCGESIGWCILESAEREPDDHVREEEQEDQANPEGRHVVEEQARQNDATFDPPSSFPRNIPSQEHADEVLDENGSAKQKEGSGHRFLKHGDNGRVHVRRPPEVEREHVDDISVELDLRRLIETILLPESFDDGRLNRRIRSQPVERVSGEIEQNEDDHRDDEKCDHALCRTPDKVSDQRGQASTPAPEPYHGTNPICSLSTEPPRFVAARIKGKGTGFSARPIRAYRLSSVLSSSSADRPVPPGDDPGIDVGGLRRRLITSPTTAPP